MFCSSLLLQLLPKGERGDRGKGTIFSYRSDANCFPKYRNPGPSPVHVMPTLPVIDCALRVSRSPPTGWMQRQIPIPEFPSLFFTAAIAVAFLAQAFSLQQRHWLDATGWSPACAVCRPSQGRHSLFVQAMAPCLQPLFELRSGRCLSEFRPNATPPCFEQFGIPFDSRASQHCGCR